MFCGYDPNMSAGLSTFGQGIIKSTLQKAKSAGRPISEHIAFELKQLRALIDNLDKAIPATQNSFSRIKIIKGLALICETCFATAETKRITNDNELQRHFEEFFIFAGDLVRELENASEACPPNTGIDEMARISVYSIVKGL